MERFEYFPCLDVGDCYFEAITTDYACFPSKVISLPFTIPQNVGLFFTWQALLSRITQLLNKPKNDWSKEGLLKIKCVKTEHLGNKNTFFILMHLI